MALDIVNTVLGLSSTSWILLFVIFILFVLAMKKVFRIVMNAVWIVLAAFLFPIFANRVLGLAVPTDMDSILLLAVAGLGAYFVYLVVKSIYSLFSLASKIGKRVVPKIEIGGKNKGGAKSESGHEENNKIKLQKMEKPKLGEPLPPQYFYKSKAKNKDPFKDYVVIGDTGDTPSYGAKSSSTTKAKPTGRSTVSDDDYVELGNTGAEKEAKDIDVGEEEKGFERDEKAFMEEEERWLKAEKMQKVKEIKSRNKGKGRRKEK